MPDLKSITSNYTFEITILGLGAVVIAAIIVYVIDGWQVPLVTRPLPVQAPVVSPAPPPSLAASTPVPTVLDPVVQQLRNQGSADTIEAIEKDLEESEFDQLDQELETAKKTQVGL